MSNSLHPAVPTAADEPTMSPIRTFRALTLASITGLALASTGCMSLVGADQATVTITNAVQPVTAGPGCAVNADPIANGVLDLALNTGYLAALNVRTNLPSTINTQQLAQQGGSYPNYGNGDANIVSFQRSYVYTRDGEVSDLPFNILQPTANVNNGAIAGLPSETTPRITSTTGIVFNEQQNLGNSTLVFVPAITPQEAAVLDTGAIGAQIDEDTRRIVIVNITLEGQTSGAGYVRSNQFSLPISLCRGCLLPPGPGEPNGCASTDYVSGASCALVGQDQPIECDNQ